jgi:hypothetical protein
MPVESATWITQLNVSYPDSSADPCSAYDDHLRLVKSAVLSTFTRLDGAVSFGATAINSVVLYGVRADLATTISRTVVYHACLEVQHNQATPGTKTRPLVMSLFVDASATAAIPSGVTGLQANYVGYAAYEITHPLQNRDGTYANPAAGDRAVFAIQPYFATSGRRHAMITSMNAGSFIVRMYNRQNTPAPSAFMVLGIAF